MGSESWAFGIEAGLDLQRFFDYLTKFQAKILSLVMDGDTYAEISEKLHINLSTVKKEAALIAKAAEAFRSGELDEFFLKPKLRHLGSKQLEGSLSSAEEAVILRDISAAGSLLGTISQRVNTKEKLLAASAKGGSSRSAAKIEAVRKNGSLGGRPRKSLAVTRNSGK